METIGTTLPEMMLLKRWTTQIIIIITIHQTHFLNHGGSLNMTCVLKSVHNEVILFEQHDYGLMCNFLNH